MTLQRKHIEEHEIDIPRKLESNRNCSLEMRLTDALLERDYAENREDRPSPRWKFHPIPYLISMLTVRWGDRSTFG